MIRMLSFPVLLLGASVANCLALVPDSAAPMPTIDAQNPSRVATPTVAFSAVRASQATRKASNKLVLSKTITDIGYGWRADQSEFICFYPGAYYFSFNALPSGGSQIKIGLMKNNEEIVSAVGDRVGATSASASAVLNLNKNDRVYLSIQEGSIHESKQDSRSYTSFSGFRVN